MRRAAGRSGRRAPTGPDPAPTGAARAGDRVIDRPELPRILAGIVPVIAGMIAAAFLWPSEWPLALRQILLAVWGVGGIILAERHLFGTSPRHTAAAIGLVRPRGRAVAVAVMASLPMWLFVPVHSALTGADWMPARGAVAILIGVILVNGTAEEVMHRAFVFGRLRRRLSFVRAATIAAMIFASQHLYLPFTIGAMAGLASVLLAALVAFPLAFLFDRGGGSIAAPAILHTGSNAPIMIFATAGAAQDLILPYMAVALASMYLGLFAARWIEHRA